MKNEVKYEWCYETVDEHGDITDSDFADHLSKFDKNATGVLCLVRNEGNEADGLEDRYWAYVYNNQLPEYFSDASGNEISIKVPQRFHNELKQYLNLT